MRAIHPKLLSIVLSIPSAYLLAPLLLDLPWLHYFLVYSVCSHFENVFLLSAISIYGLAQLIIFRLRKGYWRAVFHRVAFYIVCAEAVMVLGLVSLALLWVVPMALLLFSDSGRESWQYNSRQVHF